jgi:hypothetical protein
VSWRSLFDRILGDAPETVAILDAADRVSSGITRRHLLRSALVGAAVAATVDVGSLLWTPGEKTIFVLDGVGSNSLITPEWVTREALAILTKNLSFVYHVNREYDDAFAGIGSIKVRAK